MPTYQYACTACGHQLEAVQSFTDEPLTECPACEGTLAQAVQLGRHRLQGLGLLPHRLSQLGRFGQVERLLQQQLERQLVRFEFVGLQQADDRELLEQRCLAVGTSRCSLAVAH